MKGKLEEKEFLLFLLIRLSFETVFLCVALAVLEFTFWPGYSGTHRDLPASASQGLGLKVCATTLVMWGHQPITLSSWLLCNFIFATVMNHDTNVWFLMVLGDPRERVVQPPKGS